MSGIQWKPHHKGFAQPSFDKMKKGWGKKGKGAKRTTKQNAENKKRFIKEGIDRCQMCGTGDSLSNSHSKKSDRRLESAKTALLCIWPCHDFLEKECTSEERETVNVFLIDTNLDGEFKFEEALSLLPAEKASKWRKALLDQRLK